MTEGRAKLLLVDDDLTFHDVGVFDDEDETERMFREHEGRFPAGELLGAGRYLYQRFFDVFEVTPVTNPQAALVEARKILFDVVVLDVMMNHRDSDGLSNFETERGLRTGFVLAKLIHLLPGYSSVPIWLYSQVVPGDECEFNRETVESLMRDGVIFGSWLKHDKSGLIRDSSLHRDVLESEDFVTAVQRSVHRRLR